VKKLSDEWQFYLESVLIPSRVGAVQVTESRRVFYLGAWAFFRLLLQGCCDDPLRVTPANLENIAALDSELKDFIRELEREEAEAVLLRGGGCETN
jgi:hypothetical protein